MTAIKRALVIASVTFVSVMLYQWGHLDGREGKIVRAHR